MTCWRGPAHKFNTQDQTVQERKREDANYNQGHNVFHIHLSMRSASREAASKLSRGVRDNYDSTKQESPIVALDVEVIFKRNNKEGSPETKGRARIRAEDIVDKR